MNLSRGGWALTALAALSLGLLGPEAGSSMSAVAGPDFPRALLGLGALLQLALSGWIVVVVGASLMSRSPRVLRSITPGLLRQALFAGTVGALTLVPAQADPASAPGQTATHDLTGLRLPDRPIGSTDEPVQTVVVRPGDTLWGIAAASLPDGSSDAEVDRACARWYAANREVIGDDPDLIFPAQRLVPPLGKDPA
jgi:hypothetical protein